MWATLQLLLAASLLLLGGRAQKEGVSNVFGRRMNQSINDRSGKSLLNTFPFNRQRQDQNHHHHHHAHHQQQAISSARDSRQGSNSNEVALDIGSIAAAGEKCIDKVVMVQRTEYDDQIVCKHSYSEHCHITYKTDYEPQQEEECDDNYRKRCYIEFKNVASEEKVQFCYTPLERNCDSPSPIECSTEYRSECTTRYHEHEVTEDRPVCREEQEQKCQQVTQGYSTSEECTTWPVMKCDLETKVVKKYTPQTQCAKKPLEVCGPAACPIEPGQEQCFDKTETVVQEVPEERCTLEPQRECKQVTKLVPLLKPAEECIDIPKEVCVRQRTNPRRVQKPIIKKWCYTPTQESGDPLPDRPKPTPKPASAAQGRPQSGDSFSGQQAGARQPEGEVTTTIQGCAQGYAPTHCPQRKGDGTCHPECNTQACGFDGGDCQGCAQGYSPTHCPQRKGDGTCHPECDTQACGFDGGDCQIAQPPTNGYLPPPSAPPSGYLPPGGGGYQGKK